MGVLLRDRPAISGNAHHALRYPACASEWEKIDPAKRLRTWRYADDIIIVAETLQSFTTMASELGDALRLAHLPLDTEKREWFSNMVADLSQSIRLDGFLVPCIRPGEPMRIWGIFISRDGGHSADYEATLARLRACFHSLRGGLLQPGSGPSEEPARTAWQCRRCKVLDRIVGAILCFHVAHWDCTRCQLWQLWRTQMRMLRLAIGCPPLGEEAAREFMHRRSAEVRRVAGMAHIRSWPRLAWLGPLRWRRHVERERLFRPAAAAGAVSTFRGIRWRLAIKAYNDGNLRRGHYGRRGHEVQLEQLWDWTGFSIEQFSFAICHCNWQALLDRFYIHKFGRTWDWG